MTTGQQSGFDPAKDVALDARSLRGLAHPIRIRILASLREDGPATSTGLAQRLGESSGATSYHLRQLASHGLVDEDPDRGVGRERWWCSVHLATYSDIPGPGADEETTRLSDQYLRGIAEMHGLRMRDWLAERPGMAEPWGHLHSVGGALLRLTPKEMEDLASRISDLVNSYRRDNPDQPSPQDAERVIVQFQVMPRPGRRVPAEVPR